MLSCAYEKCSKFIVELVFTAFVALILSGIVGVVLQSLALSNGMLKEWSPEINSTVGIIFGIIVGYKLNSLIQIHKKPARKKMTQQRLGHFIWMR